MSTNRTHHSRPRRAERRFSGRTKLAVAVATLGVAAAGFGTVNAHAADAAERLPTDEELLSQCRKADVCTFTPTSVYRFIGQEHPVGNTVTNCESRPVSRTFSWSDTTNVSVNYSASLSLSATEGVLSAAFQAAAGIDFGESHTTSESVTQTVPAWYKAEITRGTPMVSVTGDWQLNFPDRFFGHYKWRDDNLTYTVEDTKSPNALVFRTRPLTDEEIVRICTFNGVPEGRGVAAMETTISAANPDQGTPPSGGPRLAADESGDAVGGTPGNPQPTATAAAG